MGVVLSIHTRCVSIAPAIRIVARDELDREERWEPKRRFGVILSGFSNLLLCFGSIRL